MTEELKRDLIDFVMSATSIGMLVWIFIEALRATSSVILSIAYTIASWFVYSGVATGVLSTDKSSSDISKKIESNKVLLFQVGLVVNLVSILIIRFAV